MKMIVYEGTVEEIAKIARALKPEAATGDSTDTFGDPERSETLVATELARRMLTRLPLSKAQTTVLKTLMDAHPEWVSRDELSAATGYSSHQLAGVMGAFGRRASKTDGYRPGIRLFDTQWNDETGAWDYRLPDTMLEALRLEKPV